MNEIINTVTSLLNISPEAVKMLFVMLSIVGAIVLYRFRKIVSVIAVFVIGIYLAIKDSFADE